MGESGDLTADPGNFLNSGNKVRCKVQIKIFVSMPMLAAVRAGINRGVQAERVRSHPLSREFTLSACSTHIRCEFSTRIFPGFGGFSDIIPDISGPRRQVA
jgi:hypothetical protein